MELKDRIRYIRHTLQLSQKAFGEKIGVAGNTVTNYEIGLRTPREQTLLSICREYNVSYDWLTTGEGDPFLKNDEELDHLLSRILNGQNEFAKRVFKEFAKLDEGEWAALERFIDRLACHEKGGI